MHILTDQRAEYDSEHKNKVDNSKTNIKIVKLEENELEFEIKGIDTSMANAIRRVLIAEVPCMAADRICIYQNTSFISDEILACRIGLVPIKANPDDFEYVKGENYEDEKSCIKFTLHIKGENGIKPSEDNSLLVSKTNVYSSHLQWSPLGQQMTKFKNNPPRVAVDSIIIAKLAHGQEIKVDIICYKGIGQKHSKWSPVSCANYRLMPYISLKQRIFGDNARRLKQYFQDGSIKLIKSDNGEVEAIVSDDVRNATNSNVTNDEILKDLVEVGRIQDHFIFTIESLGSVPSISLFRHALKVIYQKCDTLLEYFKVPV